MCHILHYVARHAIYICHIPQSQLRQFHFVTFFFPFTEPTILNVIRAMFIYKHSHTHTHICIRYAITFCTLQKEPRHIICHILQTVAEIINFVIFLAVCQSIYIASCHILHSEPKFLNLLAHSLHSIQICKTASVKFLILNKSN